VKYQAKRKGENVVKRLYTFLVASCAMVVGSAQAALNTEATSALTNIGTAVTDMESAVWPYVGAAFVALITIKLFKRFSSKI
jgi:hypothetical protein